MSTPGFIRLLTCAHGRQAEQRARLSNPVGDRMIALFRSLAGEFGVASDPPRVGEEE